MKTSIEERLAFLEGRLSALENEKSSSGVTKAEKTLSLVGLSYLLKHINENIMADPQSDRFDNYLNGIFKIEITPKNRLECADKLHKLSLSLLDEAMAETEKNRKLLKDRF